MRRILVFTLLLSISSWIACNSPTPSTPTATLKAYLESAQKKDAAAIKQNLSEGTLKIIDQTARAENINIDEAIVNDAEYSVSTKVTTLETRNEQINGDSATLEFKNPATGGWDKLYFTKEKGLWKIAKDKLMEETLRNIEETKSQP